jgi:hypothetical protein
MERNVRRNPVLGCVVRTLLADPRTNPGITNRPDGTRRWRSRHNHVRAPARPLAAAHWGRSGDEPIPVVLGDPVAVVAEAVRQLGQVDRVAQRLRRGRPLGDGGLVEDAEAQAGGHAGGYPSTAAPLAVSTSSMLPRVALE